jgi:hypothetical protein
MSLISFAESLQHTALGAALRDAPQAAVLAIQVAHVLGLILLLTSLLVVNLRLLGWGLRSLPLARVVQATRRALWLGLALTMGSGSLLFLSAPVHYAGNAAFAPKMLLLLAALTVQAILYRRLTRAGAVLSLSLWFGVGLAGRAIGFV